MTETQVHQDAQISEDHPIDSDPRSVAPVFLSNDGKVVIHPDFTTEQDFVDEYRVGIIRPFWHIGQIRT